MAETSRSKPSTLESLFKEAIEEANRADIDEPPLVWPDLPDSLKDNPKEQKSPKTSER